VTTVADLLGRWTTPLCDTTHRTGVRCQLRELHRGYHQHVGATVTVMWRLRAGVRCTCHLRVEVVGYCPVHEPAPCPSRSNGTDGWHCAVQGPHDDHANAAGDATWRGRPA